MKRKTFSLIVLILLLLNGLYSVNASTDLKLLKYEEDVQENYDLLILTPAYFKIPLIRLAKHKNSYGMYTKIVTLFELYNSKFFTVQGRDKPEQIKYFIKNAIENWNTKYVMLVGNVDKIPMRKACVWDFQVITDLYYSDIYNENRDFSNWDSNNNNKFGEYMYNETGSPNDKKTDIVDLKPDVGIGRLPCSNIIEVNTVVNKIINYELGVYYDESWFNRMIFCGGELWGESRYYKYEGWRNGIYEGECNNQIVIENMSGFTPIKLWKSLGNINPKSINEEINKGAGFAYFSGHGVPYLWVPTDPYLDEAKNQKYWFYKISQLSNGYKLPVMFFDSCLTGQLDYKLLGMPFDCISWRFVKQKNGGSIANIASSRIAFMGPIEGGGTMLALYFFENYSHDEPRILSNMFMQAQREYINNFGDCFTLFEYNIIGDPSLRIGGYSNNEQVDNINSNLKYEKGSNLESILDRILINLITSIETKKVKNLISKGKNNNFVTEKIDPEWLKIYDSGYEDVSNAVAVDSNNNIIISGYSFHDSKYKICTFKYDQNGNKLWDLSINNAKSDIFFSHDITIDSDDNIFIVGFEGNWTNDFFPRGCVRLYKYDKDGNEIWNKSYERGFFNMGTGIAIDNDDNIVLISSLARAGEAGLGGWIAKCDGDQGNLTWERIYHKYFFNPPKTLAFDSENNIIIVGDGGLVFKYDKNGFILWEKKYSSGEETIYDVEIDSQDNIVIAGAGYRSAICGDHFTYYSFTMKLDDMGKVLWKEKYSSGIFGNDMAFAVTVDSQNNIFVGCTSYPYAELKPSGENVNPFILKYNKDGELLLVKQHDISGTIYDLSFNQNGKLITTGINIGVTDDYYVSVSS
jgi:hypothetical protein